jgi:hypothetical protein
MRHIGLEAPLHPLQVVSWVLFVAIVGSFVVLYAIVHWGLASAPIGGMVLTILYALAVVVQVCSLGRAQLLDPADPGLLALRLRRPDGEVPPPAMQASSTQKTTTRPRHCYMCDCNVQPRSRHCRICDKCVDVYDHHCPWLNTCIGRANYRSFITGVTATTLVTFVQLVAFAHAGSLLASGDDSAAATEQRQRVGSLLGLTAGGYAGVLLGVGALILVLCVNLVGLLQFHVRLARLRMTTMEYFTKHPMPSGSILQNVRGACCPGC